MTDQIIDADFGEEAEIAQAAKDAGKKGATFASVYGPKIYDGARMLLSVSAQKLGWDSRERAAAWPGLILGQVSHYAWQAEKQGLEGVPDRKTIDREMQKSDDFRRAYEAVSGVALNNSAREYDLTDEARAVAVNQCGSPKLSAHDRLDRARQVPAPLRAQAKELHDTGVCSYTESAIALGQKYANGERDRATRVSGKVRRRPERGGAR
ncbi:hypothetical protein [Roseovarius indicus]|uniref:hypothetical protein n=1 Tax=Roseovarius indicus TaxID=540747 RepID=UPI0032EF1F64